MLFLSHNPGTEPLTVVLFDASSPCRFRILTVAVSWLLL